MSEERHSRRILVCGGRNYTDTARVHKALTQLKKRFVIDAIIEGNASGVDRIAGYWARKNKIDDRKFPPDWQRYGKAAGPIRNQQMLDEGKPNLVVAFPGGSGTADMVRRAKAAGIEVIEII